MRVSEQLPVVSGPQMAAVDRAMVDRCGLDLLQVMEVAGRSVAIAARELHPGGPVAILCGSGGNGGDGFVCARYLWGWGHDVRCWSTKPIAGLHGLALHQAGICDRLGIPVHGPESAVDLTGVAFIVDGLFGFGIASAPAGRAAELIEIANRSTLPVLAIDLPSGIDATSGVVFQPAIRASATLTLGLPKLGLLVADGPVHAGTVIVAEIGIPAAAYAAVGIPPTSIFDCAEFVTLDGCPWPG